MKNYFLRSRNRRRPTVLRYDFLKLRLEYDTIKEFAEQVYYRIMQDYRDFNGVAASVSPEVACLFDTFCYSFREDDRADRVRFHFCDRAFVDPSVGRDNVLIETKSGNWIEVKFCGLL